MNQVRVLSIQVPVAPRRTPLSELWNDARRLPSPVIVNFSKKCVLVLVILV